MDGTLIHNIATAKGMSAFGPVGPVYDDATVCVIHPDIEIVKTVEPDCVTVTEASPTTAGHLQVRDHQHGRHRAVRS